MADEKLWRVGRKVPINVYLGDAPVCQCHTPEMAARIVSAMNQSKEIRQLRAALEWYADPRTWNQWLPDSAGDRARKALADSRSR